RAAGPLGRGDDVASALGSAVPISGVPLSQEMVALALANSGAASVEARAAKLAFLVLTTVPSSAVARLLAAVARRAYRRAGPALSPSLDADDLLSLLRWKLWTLPPEYLTPTRILRHPGLAAYVS